MAQIALGTAQLGLDYGISNTHGQVSYRESKSILDFAEKNGITILDTAAAYGNSEEILGDILSVKDNNHFNLVTKIPVCRKNEIEYHFTNSLKKLNCKSIYGLLFHNFQVLSYDFSKWDILDSFKKVEKVKKIGISLYHPAEWIELKEKNIIPDIVQLPSSIFDQRFIPYLKEMKDMGIEIHVRSVFLQGLFFMDIKTLSTFFTPVKDNLKQLHEISLEKKISIASLCLNFVNAFKNIDHIILGVDKLQQLKENIKLLNNNEKELQKLKQELIKIKIKDERMVLPYLWPKK